MGIMKIRDHGDRSFVDPKGKIVKVVTGEDPSFYTFLDSLFE